MSSFDSYRSLYPSFIYKSYHIEDEGDTYRIEYIFDIPGLKTFKPYWIFPKGDFNSNSECIDRLVFSLGMVESISYYKCVCPKEFVIECGSLTLDQQKWWKKLFYNGLGEFMYRNQIEVSMDDLFSFNCDASFKEPIHDENTYSGFFIPVGGGKDSVVTLELLKDQDVVTYHINSTRAVKEVIDLYGEKKGDYNPKRFLDNELLQLNKEGFLNGHTPFSAIVAFSSYLSALLCGKRFIALSNETSANESTVPGSFVNHQYSKSYEFEEDFNEYVHTLCDSNILYFSFLRPLVEIQIAERFARFKKYFPVFQSCNVGSKKGVWCCDCPKCLFVYIILVPFLKKEELDAIFHENLLNKESLEKDFRELVGIDPNKPFECVGTRKEVRAALKEAIRSNAEGYLLTKYRNEIFAEETELSELLGSYELKNNVPVYLLNRLMN